MDYIRYSVLSQIAIFLCFFVLKEKTLNQHRAVYRLNLLFKPEHTSAAISRFHPSI